MEKDLTFPKNFVWGADTSAYQVEGGRDERGDSIWDEYCEIPGVIKDGSSGTIACDHYHRYKEDIGLLNEIGVDAYRFSLSWPRLMGESGTKFNEKGIDFYNRLIDGLLEKNITPYLTLYHWDLPIGLHEKGGWLNEDMPKYFYDYAYAVGEFFGDRVKNLITFNEPQCFLPYGYGLGQIHAPGFKVNDKEFLFSIHNFLRSHGMAVQALRSTVKNANIGIAMTGNGDYPLTDLPEDVAAAKKDLLSLKEKREDWTWDIIHWSDPIFLGDYPKESYEKFGDLLPIMTAEDKKLIGAPLDFFGLNLYTGDAVCADGKGGYKKADFPLGGARNSLGWKIAPKSLYFATKTIYERYKKPVYITENGVCCNDWIHEDGKVHDPERIDYMKKYLKMLHRAMDEGADVRGYFVWSFLDNFEWAQGYAPRFGLVYVDYETQERTLKDSAYFYRDFINEQKK